MTARHHHLRHVALCGALLLLLMALAWTTGTELSLLDRALSTAPFALAGTFVFNRFQRSRQNRGCKDSELDAVPAQSGIQLANTVSLLALIFGLACAAVAVMAPSHLAAVVWIVPVLAGSIGIHLEAVS
ncbi:MULTISPECIES: hypothetical protein [unclassified Roseateles]|jgi:hypothetical protein|uniref:hypothetical protein n=1 Tax=unclassified Roseateles TaxID=2626991 RepID=UPI0007142629|nr:MULTISPECIES: hypothetical protein [unclassified Roseateles]KQW51605.1 hypothetical protein ASC81_02945 [Pelomonas sp. Root405]KRA77838.1 hypothetical protein ASD88_02945 [Pelomonas sp. Root662]